MMTLIPLVPTRSRWVDPRSGLLTRDAIEYLNAMRLNVGGDAAQTVVADELGPVSAVRASVAALDPVAVSGDRVDLSPVSRASEAFSGLGPV